MDREVFLFFVVMKWNQELQNASHGEKRMKNKVEIKTQNEKIVETDMDIWY